MPQLNSDNSVQVRIESSSDGKGVEDAQKGLKELAVTGGDTDKKLGIFTSNFTDGLNKVAGVTAVVGAGLTLYAKNGVDKLGDLVKGSKTLATQTGMTAVESSKLVAVFGRMGTDSSALAANFRIFSKTIADARDNVGENALKQKELANKVEETKIKIAELTTEIRVNGDATGSMKNRVEGLKLTLEGYEKNLGDTSNGLTKLGISTVDAQGKNKGFNDILMEVADKFKDMPGGAEKTAIALDLFGRSGAGMIKVLDKGSEGITKLSKAADDLGLTLTNDNIATMDAYVKSQKELADSTGAISLAVGALTAPLLTEMNLQLNNVITSLIGADNPMRELTVGVLAFGGPVLAATSGVLGFVANLGTAIPVFKQFAGLVRTPIIMPAIGVAAALTALGLVIAKINEVNSAIKGAKSSVASLESEGASVRSKAKAKYEAGEMSEAAYKKTVKIGYEMEAEAQRIGQQEIFTGFFGPMLKYGSEVVDWFSGGSKFASGTNSAPGGRALVGENGPEIVDLPQGSKVYTNKDSQRMAGSQGGMVINIQQAIFSTSEAVDTFMNYRDQDSQMTQLGLSPARGVGAF